MLGKYASPLSHTSTTHRAAVSAASKSHVLVVEMQPTYASLSSTGNQVAVSKPTWRTSVHPALRGSMQSTSLAPGPSGLLHSPNSGADSKLH